MSTPGQISKLFPVVAPGGGAPWWIVSSSATANTGLKVVQASIAPSLAIAGPYDTKAAAEAALPGLQAAPTGSILGVAASNALSGLPIIGSWAGALGSIASTLSRLASAQLWERIGEVALGLLLIAVGVAHITHAVPIATKIAKTAGAAAAVA